MLATLRKGLTTLETAGYAAGSLVLHPLDWKDMELARASSKRRRALELAQAAGGALLDKRPDPALWLRALTVETCMSLNPPIAAVAWFLSRGPAVCGPMGIGVV